MHELTGKISNVSLDFFTGKHMVTFTVDGSASEMLNELRECENLTIKVDKQRQKRSLDANAYFHVLVNKIAAKINESDDEVKRKLVIRYGTLARDNNGDLYGAMLPASADPDRFYPYTRSYKTVYRDGMEYYCYLFYERTRDLDTSQMARLIDGTVQEAKNLGIETMTPMELARLKEVWHGSG